MATTPGTIIAGRYELLGTAGHGGMATVFRARRRSDGAVVAVKILYDQFAHAPEFVGRFEREARAAASLAHPNVVRVLDSGEDRGVHYIVMEHVEGETLKEVIRREGGFDPDRACAIAAQVCDALDYAHRHGIVHRDIKPQNILLTAEGAVKVADFGIARALAGSTITQPGSVVGSAQYLSPEQARGDAAGARSDIYALGVVLYEMVTGRLPFAGESPVALALKHIREAPPAPRSLDGRIPPRVEQIILRAMSKLPEQRYASAGEMRDDLLDRSAHWQDAPTVVLPPEDATAILPAVEASALPPAAVSVPSSTTGRRHSLFGFLGATAVFAILLGAWFAAGAPGLPGLPAGPSPSGATTETVGVPDLRGLPIDRAEALAAELDLRVRIADSTFHRTYPKNMVVDQSPAVGRTVRRQALISVVLSRGAPAQPQAAAPPPAAEQEAIQPEPDKPAPKDGKGKKEDEARAAVEVPDLRGATVDQAAVLLAEAGLTLGSVEETALVDAPAGSVISQFPAPQTPVPPGTAVNVLVSGPGTAP